MQKCQLKREKKKKKKGFEGGQNAMHVYRCCFLGECAGSLVAVCPVATSWGGGSCARGCSRSVGL